MTIELSVIERLWRSYPDVDIAEQFDGITRRLRDALAQHSDGHANNRDLVALTRQLLLEHDPRNVAQRSTITVPLGERLPTTEQWRKGGCDALMHGAEAYITAKDWFPPSDDRTTAAEDVVPVYRGQKSKMGSFAADPFWTQTLGERFVMYKSDGQRQAARAAVTAPPGSTLIVCLPTGQGKTEVALSALLPATRTGGVAVMVVPTVVLAQDMERRLRAYFSAVPNFAYVGGLDEITKQEMRRAIREGRQPVVVAAPEAVMTGLGAALDVAASQGHLTHLVIDEAHLVEQWGSSFRPDFKAVAAKRRHWLESAPTGRALVTIAMSATLTNEQVCVLEDSFGEPGPVEVVWASSTRREPAYFLEKHESRTAREEAVLTAVTRLPRPLILYTTTRDDTAYWLARLREHGFDRVQKLDGDSDDLERRDMVAGLRGEDASGAPMPTRYDVGVGTSAFGLGLDIPDIRSVVHATIPETIDRYYQEVGRAGRDGRASVAYLAASPDDDQVAKSVNGIQLLTDDLAWQHWRAMRRWATELPGRRVEIDLSRYRPGIGMESKRNEKWNASLLHLMERAGLITLNARTVIPDETDEPNERRVIREVTEHDTRINEEQFFKDVINRERDIVKREQNAALDRMQDLIRGAGCVSTAIADYYRLNRDGGQLRTLTNCRGCPECRRELPVMRREGLRRGGSDPMPDIPRWPCPVDPLSRYRGPSSWLSIRWDDPKQFNDLFPHVISSLARRGVAVVGGPGVTPELLARAQKSAAPFPIILDIDEVMVELYDGPIVWAASPGEPLSDSIVHRLKSGAPTYLVHRADLGHPDRPATQIWTIEKTVRLDLLAEQL